MAFLFSTESGLPYEARELARRLPTSTPGDPTRLAHGETLPAQLVDLAGETERKQGELNESTFGFSERAELDVLEAALQSLVSRAKAELGDEFKPRGILSRAVGTVIPEAQGALDAATGALDAAGETVGTARKILPVLLWSVVGLAVAGAAYLLFRAISTGKFKGAGVSVG